MTGFPLLRVQRSAAAFASREGRPISVGTFLNDVAALAEMLPARGHVINLCGDRYRFAVGFAAALCRGQVNLLPPHDAPDLLEQLGTDYPDLYCLTEDASAQRPASSRSNTPSVIRSATAAARRCPCSRRSMTAAVSVHLGFDRATEASCAKLGRTGHQRAGRGRPPGISRALGHAPLLCWGPCRISIVMGWNRC